MNNFAVIFDMDGVMVDNMVYHDKAWREFCRLHDIHLSEEEFYDQTLGRINADILRSFFGDNITDEEIAAYTKQKEDIYQAMFAKHVTPVKGLMLFLDVLKKENIPRAIATSAPVQNVTFTLKSINIEGYFETILDASDVTKGKPDPEIYLKSAEALGVDPSKCVVFEDSLHGIHAAQVAGMKVIALTTTVAREEIKADLIVDDFSTITLDVVRELL
jgi:beta-phosphoglucomutase